MNENIIKLRIKIKHLAAEARINRAEANKLSGLSKHSLNHHRKWDIRNEARATLLAYCLLRGVPYRQAEARVIEQGKFDYWILPRVRKMAAKYPVPGMQPVDDWLAGKPLETEVSEHAQECEEVPIYDSGQNREAVVIRC